MYMTAEKIKIKKKKKKKKKKKEEEEKKERRLSGVMPGLDSLWYEIGGTLDVK